MDLDEFDDLEPIPEPNPYLRVLVAFFLISLIILMGVPFYGIKSNPHPRNIPTIDEVIPDNSLLNGTVIKAFSESEIQRLVNPSDPIIKTVAGRIIGKSCKKQSRICQAKALYYFTRDNFNYISDPQAVEYIEDPKLFLASYGGDCESGTLFLANMMESIGINAQIVFVPNHALLRIWLPESVKAYKGDYDWIYLDWTCDSCDFGELARNYPKKSILEVP